jgi:hypothetical protein
MKRAFLLIVVPALLVALGFAQTPAASVNTEQTNIKGCLGGSDGNYTVVEDNTGDLFKITSSSVDLKSHLGHDVKVIGHKANEVSFSAYDSFAVTELNMISEHCAATAAAPLRLSRHLRRLLVHLLRPPFHPLRLSSRLWRLPSHLLRPQHSLPCHDTCGTCQRACCGRHYTRYNGHDA